MVGRSDRPFRLLSRILGEKKIVPHMSQFAGCFSHVLGERRRRNRRCRIRRPKSSSSIARTEGLCRELDNTATGFPRSAGAR
jgi:hypothetical protein